MLKIYQMIVSFLAKLSALPPLALRLILAYGFYGPAKEKATNFEDTVQWFAEGLKLPLPELNAVMAVGTECAGVVLMTLGLATRLISLPMMVIMVVAMITVHLPDGFAACQPVTDASGVIEKVKYGIEIPFYYFWMLFVLLISGPGKISLDHLIQSRISKS